MPHVVDPAKTNALIDAYEQAVAALAQAKADIDAEIARLRTEYTSAASPGVKAAITKGIRHLRHREKRWIG